MKAGSIKQTILGLVILFFPDTSHQGSLGFLPPFFAFFRRLVVHIPLGRKWKACSSICKSPGVFFVL